VLTYGNVATVDPDDCGIGQARVFTPRTTVRVSAAPALNRPVYPIDPTWGTLLHDFEAGVATLINQHRASIGVPALKHSTGALTYSAEWKSMHMAKYQYMTHDDPAPPVMRSIADRIFDAGYGDYEGEYAWGENIAYGFLTPADVMAAWLSDVGHKANVEQSFWVAVGVGVAQAANGLIFWATDFGTTDPPVGGGSPPPPPPPPPPPGGTVLQEWLNTVLPLIEATPQYQKWHAATSKAGHAEAARWDAYLANPHAAPPTMTTAYGKSLVADLHLAATQ